jgi:hypothetical protein
LDLREWVSPEALLSWIGEELSALDVPGRANHAMENETSSPNMMLTILSFAYSTGRFESEDIIHECRADPLFHSLGPGETAWPEDVAHLRRQNRGLLITVLARLLGRAFRQHFGIDSAVLPAKLKQSFHEEAVERLDIARHMDVANAE